MTPGYPVTPLSRYPVFRSRYSSRIAMNRSDFDPFRKPKRSPASLAKSSRMYSGTENSIFAFRAGLSRGGRVRFELVASAGGGVPFRACPGPQPSQVGHHATSRSAVAATASMMLRAVTTPPAKAGGFRSLPFA